MLAGDEFVLNFERVGLMADRREHLAGKIEQVSHSRGEHEGYDDLRLSRRGGRG